MDITTTPTITQIGLSLPPDTTFDAWAAIGKNFGSALQSATWCIGDWMLFGTNKWGGAGADAAPGCVSAAAMDDAIAATTLDRQAIATAATVCRKIPMSQRSARLSFAHHRVIAPLPPALRQQWFDFLESAPDSVPTVRRLSLSVRSAHCAPRIISDDEIENRGPNGRATHAPHLLRLLAVLRKNLPGMTEYQRAALKRDLAPLIELIAEI